MMQKWEPPKTSKEIQSHLCKQLDFMCIYISTYCMLTEVTRIIQGRKGAKQRIRGRLSAVLVHGVIREGRPHPLCQQTLKHYSHSLVVTNGSLRSENIEKSANEGALGSLWYVTLHDGRRHLSEARREPPGCWPSTFPLISINTASKRARFVFKVLSQGFIKGWDVAVMSIWVNLHINVSGGVTAQSVHVALCITASSNKVGFQPH